VILDLDHPWFVPTRVVNGITLVAVPAVVAVLVFVAWAVLKDLHHDWVKWNQRREHQREQKKVTLDSSRSMDLDEMTFDAYVQRQEDSRVAMEIEKERKRRARSDYFRDMAATKREEGRAWEADVNREMMTRARDQVPSDPDA
jgi:hypothetical protein